MKTLSRSLAILGLSLLAAIVAPQSAKAQIVPLIDSGDTWQVLDNGSSLPNPAWLAAGYADTSSPWRALPSSFGYDVTNSVWTSGGATSLLNYSVGNNQPSAKYITTYFRKKFTLTASQATGASRFTSLLIGLRYDDGVVIYLNGTEIKRENMPTGTVTGTTGAASAIEVAANLSFFTYQVPSGLLLTGTNTVAVELHQANATSSDVFFEMTVGASTSPPCFGDATVGIYQDFQDSLVSLPTSNHYGYLRDPFNSKTLLQFDAVATQRATYFTNGVGIITPPVPGATGQLSFSKNCDFSFTTERIDTQNYGGVKASVGIRSSITGGIWTSSDFIKGTIFYSTDGQTYSSTPWFNYQTGVNSTVQTTLAAETSPYFWLVPTINQAPSNTTTNPTDWFQRVPAGWSAYNVKPASWKDGNNGAGVKGGVGFDTSPTPVDYTPNLDAQNSTAIRTEMTSKETRINVRIPFTMPNIAMANVSKVELFLRYDDGVGVWINGASVTDAAFFAPATDAALAPNRDDATANSPVAYDITTAFKANVTTNSANNILALRGYNTSTTSSDLIVNWKLVIHTPGPVNPNSPAGIESTGALSTVSTGNLIPQSVRSVKFKIEGTASATSAGEVKAFFLDNFSVTGTPSAAVDLGSTLSLQLPEGNYSPEQRAQLADPDGDGIPNLLEYAFGGHAGISKRTALLPNSTVQYLTPTVLDAPGGYVRLQFRTIAGPYDSSALLSGEFKINDLRYFPQTSPDNGDNWVSLGKFLLDGAPVSNEDGTQTVIFKTQDPLVGPESKYFFRVRVETARDPWLSSGYDFNNPCPFPE